MNAKSHYLIQVLEKIGAPLMSAIVEVSAGTPGKDVAEDAQRMAELLARTTQSSIEIAGVISPANAVQDDAFRLSLAALLAPVIADHYRYDREVPSEADLKKIIAALQTVVTFSDNFEAEEKNAAALQNIEGGAFDPVRVMQLQILALTPVVNAVGSFSFGINEPKLINDVAERLVQKSLTMGAQWFSGADDIARKRGSLEILKSLARIYAACHQAETARLQSGGAGGIEDVWKNFDIRIALLETLATGLLGTGSSTDARTPVAAQAPPPQPATAPAESSGGGGFNPMGGFVKKPAGAPAAPPPAEQKPAEGGFNPMGGFSKKPPEPPPAVAPAQPPGGAQPPTNPPSNPMGFFKKKDDG